MFTLKYSLMLIAVFFLIACSHNNVKTNSLQNLSIITSAAVIACKNPRPEMCTREFRPVCALKDNGVRCKKAPCPDFDKVTYPNSCVACSDVLVRGYQKQACDDGQFKGAGMIKKSYSY